MGVFGGAKDEFAEGVLEWLEDVLEEVLEVGVVGPNDLFFEEFGGVGGGDKVVLGLDMEYVRIGSLDKSAVEKEETDLPEEVEWKEKGGFAGPVALGEEG